jgi:N6-adenosine-specific RNA methylase IME4
MASIQAQQTKSGTYYYLAERIDGKVVKTYLGTKPPIRRSRGWTNLSQDTVNWIKRQRQAPLKPSKIQTPSAKYRTMVVDPPWPMEEIQLRARSKEDLTPYPLLSIAQIKKGNGRIPIKRLADKTGCHLFLWTTQHYLTTAIEILQGWGFKHILTMVWHKNAGMQPFNLPQYNCEFILFGRRGKIQFLETRNFATCFYALRREHSRKPDKFYELVKRVSPAPRIDMFSREKRDGFDQYGNEVSKYGDTETNSN